MKHFVLVAVVVCAFLAAFCALTLGGVTRYVPATDGTFARDCNAWVGTPSGMVEYEPNERRLETRVLISAPYDVRVIAEDAITGDPNYYAEVWCSSNGYLWATHGVQRDPARSALAGVWRSADGVTWEKVTAAHQFKQIMAAGGHVYGSKGDPNNGYINGLWRCDNPTGDADTWTKVFTFDKDGPTFENDWGLRYANGVFLITGYGDNYPTTIYYSTVADPNISDWKVAHTMDTETASMWVFDTGDTIYSDASAPDPNYWTNAYQPFPDTPAIGDAVYFGFDYRQTSMLVDVATAAVWTGNSCAWTYWNGSTWAAFGSGGGLGIDYTPADPNYSTGYRPFGVDGGLGKMTETYAYAWRKSQPDASMPNKFWIKCALTATSASTWPVLAAPPEGLAFWHVHTAGYHAASDTWVVSIGDGTYYASRIILGRYNSTADTWTWLEPRGLQHLGQPTAFADYGDADYIAIGSDSAWGCGRAKVSVTDPNNIEFINSAPDVDQRGNAATSYIWGMAADATGYYAPTSATTSVNYDFKQNVIWASPNGTDWAPYYRYSNVTTEVGTYASVGAQSICIHNGRIYFNAICRELTHDDDPNYGLVLPLSIPVPQMQTVSGLLIEPAATNIADPNLAIGNKTASPLFYRQVNGTMSVSTDYDHGSDGHSVKQFYSGVAATSTLQIKYRPDNQVPTYTLNHPLSMQCWLLGKARTIAVSGTSFKWAVDLTPGAADPNSRDAFNVKINTDSFTSWEPFRLPALYGDVADAVDPNYSEYIDFTWAASQPLDPTTDTALVQAYFDSFSVYEDTPLSRWQSPAEARVAEVVELASDTAVGTGWSFGASIASYGGDYDLPYVAGVYERFHMLALVDHTDPNYAIEVNIDPNATTDPNAPAWKLELRATTDGGSNWTTADTSTFRFQRGTVFKLLLRGEESRLALAASVANAPIVVTAAIADGTWVSRSYDILSGNHNLTYGSGAVLLPMIWLDAALWDDVAFTDAEAETALRRAIVSQFVRAGEAYVPVKIGW